MNTLIAIGAGIAVLGALGAGAEATAIYGFVIALMVIVMLK